MKVAFRLALIGLSAFVFAVGGYYFGSAQDAAGFVYVGEASSGRSPTLHKFTDGAVNCYVVQGDPGSGGGPRNAAVSCVK